ncbi:MAG: hypothetical protein ABJA62_10985 [Luteimonas sp.]
MNLDIDIDDIEIERANSLFAKLFDLPRKDYLEDYSLLEPLVKQHGIEIEGTNLAMSRLPESAWSARVSEDFLPTQYGATRAAAAMRMLMVKRFESDQPLRVPLDEIVATFTELKLIQFIKESSPFHTVEQSDGIFSLKFAGDESDDVEAFQLIVKAAYRLQRKSFLKICGSPHVSADCGDGWIDEISFHEL